jgi:hypothetical protein
MFIFKAMYRMWVLWPAAVCMTIYQIIKFKGDLNKMEEYAEAEIARLRTQLKHGR